MHEIYRYVWVHMDSQETATEKKQKETALTESVETQANYSALAVACLFQPEWKRLMRSFLHF